MLRQVRTSLVAFFSHPVTATAILVFMIFALVTFVEAGVHSKSPVIHVMVPTPAATSTPALTPAPTTGATPAPVSGSGSGRITVIRPVVVAPAPCVPAGNSGKCKK